MTKKLLFAPKPNDEWERYIFPQLVTTKQYLKLCISTEFFFFFMTTSKINLKMSAIALGTFVYIPTPTATQLLSVYYMHLDVYILVLAG